MRPSVRTLALVIALIVLAVLVAHTRSAFGW